MAERYRFEIWQDGVRTDFGPVHRDAMRLALLHGDDCPVEVRGVPADKRNELMAALGCLRH